MSRRRDNYCSHEELDTYRHEMVLFIANVLKERLVLSIDEVCELVAKRGNLKNLKRIASGETLEARVQVFLWQHPSIFTIENKDAFLTRMSADLDIELEKTKEQRALEYLVFRTQQYGFMQVLMSTLFGHLQHASNDIKTYFSNNYTFFYNFLKNQENVFVILDTYVVIKQVFDTSVAEQKVLPKSDEYFIDNRVSKSTQMIVNVEDGQHIIDYIIKTKKVVAIDCEGVNLGAKNGYITLVQLAFVDCHDVNVPDITPYIRVYLFDVYQKRELLPHCLKRLLQAPFVTKIFQGCSADSTSLYMKHKISLRNVFDTVIAHRYLNNGGKADLYSLYEHYVGEQANRMKRDIKKQYIGNPRLWATRPLTDNLKYYAAFDVFSLIRVYFAMIPKISVEAMEIITGKSNKLCVNSAQRANGGEYYNSRTEWNYDGNAYSNGSGSYYRNYDRNYDRSHNWWQDYDYAHQNYTRYNGNFSAYNVPTDHCHPSSSHDTNVPQFQNRYNGCKQSNKSNSYWNTNAYYDGKPRRVDHQRRHGEYSNRHSFKENLHRKQ